MDNVTIVEKGILASFIAVLSFIYSSFGVLFAILVVLMAIDYVTGFASALIRNEQKSRTGLLGILKKVGYVALVVTALLFDMVSIQAANQLGVTIPITGFFGTIVICWLISNEGLSIVENLGEIGVPAPKFIKQILEGLREFFEKFTQKKD